MNEAIIPNDVQANRKILKTYVIAHLSEALEKNASRGRNANTYFVFLWL